MPSQGDGPFTVHLLHGWTASGPLRVSYQPDERVITANQITVREVETIKGIVTPKSLLNMFELDDQTIIKGPEERGYSQADRIFLHKVEEGIQKVGVHHEITLPFRDPNPEMPNNRVQGKTKSRQLNVFSDVSSTGYGSVAYLRLQDTQNRVHCPILMERPAWHQPRQWQYRI